MSLSFSGQNSIKKILAIGAHSDDIEIGCGGTLLQFDETADAECEVCWVVFSGESTRKQEAESSARSFIKNSKLDLHLLEFPDRYFPEHWQAIKKALHEIGSQFAPDLVLTHRLNDRHQDHQVLADISWHAFRQHLLLEYEIPKYEGDLQDNNCFVDLSPATCSKKIDLLTTHFSTQTNKHWFDEELFRGLMRIRGAESPSNSKYAEAFYCRKFSLSLG